MKTETKVQHTQEEWNYTDSAGFFYIESQQEKITIAAVYRTADEEGRANAALICKAVNNFYPMLEALREGLSDLFYQIESKHGAKVANEYPAIVKMKAIIKAAEQA